jgi:hypothetical protein
MNEVGGIMNDMILIGPAGSETFAAELLARGVDPSECRTVQYGTFAVADVDGWVGISAPPDGVADVDLRAPEPHPDDSGKEWLVFNHEPFGLLATATTNMIAVISPSCDMTAS